MLPADQRLDGADVRGVQRDLGLVVQAQLVAFHRAAQFAEQRQMFLLAGVVVLVVGREARLVALGRVHGDVGVAHQRLRVAPVLGVVRDADAGADVERLAFEEDRRLERGDDLRARSSAKSVRPACRTRMANSSPPSRAMHSALVTVRCRRALTSRSTWSPTP